MAPNSSIKEVHGNIFKITLTHLTCSHTRLNAGSSGKPEKEKVDARSGASSDDEVACPNDERTRYEF